MSDLFFTADEQEFSDRINEDLEKFCGDKDRNSILILPPLDARHRWILHQIRESRYPDLFTFSLGENRNSRRTIISWKSQMMEQIVHETSAENSTDDNKSATKRRPDQLLYRPPRRSETKEMTATKPVEPEKQNKTKSARPSAERYVPPSRRSTNSSQQTSDTSNSIEITAKEEKTVDKEEKTDDKEDKPKEEDDEDDWEQLMDKDEDFFKKNLLEIQKKFKETVQIKNPTNDYSNWTVEDLQSKETDLSHVIEVSNFPPTIRTEDLHGAFSSVARRSFEIKWVDETHALIVFPDANAALNALQMVHPMFKVLPMSEASAASKKKAKTSIEFLQPFKARPETSSLAANRRICAVLGVKNPMSSEKAKLEREKLEAARTQKRREKEEKNQMWEGAGFSPSSNQ